MKHFNFLTVLIAVCFFLFTGCKKEIKSDSMISQNVGNPDSKTSVNLSAKKLAEFKEKMAKLKASLPADFQQKMQENRRFIQKMDPQYREMVLRALKVEVACDDNTALFQWLDQQLADWDAQLFDYVFNQFDAIDLPFFYSLIYENSSANQHFGINGEYTQILTKTFKDLKRFWNIQTDDIVMVPMHGSMLRDREKLIKTYMNAFIGIDQELAEWLADGVLSLLEAFPQLRNGDHPIFTFNSVSIPPLDWPGIGLLPPKIVMGDGIMQGFTAIGFGDVAPQAILAHEYGHQVQFQLGVNTDESTPEGSRETELMADAYAAYYLSHARGASMQWKRVRQFLQVFFNIGDCQTTAPGHHGTPNQRMAASEWAYNLANDAQKQGHILSSQEFTALFEAALPQILNH
ncbi:MAG TPA: hypothetical protein VGW31_00280 [Hanamia sp.]|nr:hypothetical protein [Hanamia sp.]